jgi:hypothetical protein
VLRDESKPQKFNQRCAARTFIHNSLYGLRRHRSHGWPRTFELSSLWSVENHLNQDMSY